MKRKYPNAVESLDHLTDTTKQAQVVWRFNSAVSDPRSHPYGVLITLKDKSIKFDSLKAALGKEFQKPFEALFSPEHMGEYEYYEKDPSLGVLQVTDEIQLSLSKGKFWPGTTYLYNDDIVISLCYGLSSAQKERFALKQGDIYPRD
ncbi:hypothetical protein [Spirosoma fluminis]